MFAIGVTQRMNSSVATVMSAPSRRSCHWSGCAARSSSVRPITVRVVSAPPSSSEQAVGQSRVRTGERFVVDGGLGPDAHDVVDGALALLVVELGACSVELRSRQASRRRSRYRRATSTDDGALRPVHELGPHLAREAEEVADHHRRQRRREIVHDLRLPPRAATASSNSVTVSRTWSSQFVTAAG